MVEHQQNLVTPGDGAHAGGHDCMCLAQIAAIIARHQNHTAPAISPNVLTPRHLQVVTLIARGLSLSETASELGVARDTVKTQLYAIHRRLGVHNRAGLVAWAVKSGLA